MIEVIFDSNAYRIFVRGKSLKQYSCELEAIKKLERKKGIQPIQSITVLSELFKHLLDNTNGNYQECKDAVIASSTHCAKTKGNLRTYAYAPSFDNALYLEATGRNFPNVDYEKSVSMIADGISKNQTDIYISSIRASLSINIQNEQQNRDNFFLSIKNVMKSLDPKSNDFTDFMKDKTDRRNFITFLGTDSFEKMTTFSKLDRIPKFLDPTFTITPDLVDRVSKKYLPLIQFERKFWNKVVNGIGIIDSSHKEFNTFYDIMIIFGALARNQQAIFVTNEKQIKESFAEVGLQNQIMTLDEYLKYLEKGNLLFRWCCLRKICCLKTLFN